MRVINKLAYEFVPSNDAAIAEVDQLLNQL